MRRPSKIEYYLGIAKAVSMRSTCIRRRFGAIIVKDDAIVSTGYNGPARGVVNCQEVGCLKDLVGAEEYGQYDLCPAVHAEENAIINAARTGSSVKDGVMFIYGEYSQTGEISVAIPCDRCKRAIINSGIKEVYTMGPGKEIVRYNVMDCVKYDSENYINKIKSAKKGQKNKI